MIPPAGGGALRSNSVVSMMRSVPTNQSSVSFSNVQDQANDSKDLSTQDNYVLGVNMIFKLFECRILLCGGDLPGMGKPLGVCLRTSALLGAIVISNI